MKSEKVKVYFMRHAYSETNMISMPLGSPERFDIKYLDPPLHQKGVEQCKFIAVELSKYTNIKYLFVSPLIRARQTAILSTLCLHNIQYFVHPLLIENIIKPSSIPTLFKQLPSENINLMYFPEYADRYYYLKGIKYEKEIVDISKDKCLADAYLATANKMKHLQPIKFESDEEFMKRMMRVIEFMRSFIEERQVKDGEILVVTHTKVMDVIEKLLKMSYSKHVNGGIYEVSL